MEHSRRLPPAIDDIPCSRKPKLSPSSSVGYLLAHTHTFRPHTLRHCRGSCMHARWNVCHLSADMYHMHRHLPRKLNVCVSVCYETEHRNLQSYANHMRSDVISVWVWWAHDLHWGICALAHSTHSIHTHTHICDLLMSAKLVHIHVLHRYIVHII